MHAYIYIDRIFKIEMGNALHWAVLSNNNEAIALFLGRNDAIDKMVKMELDDIIENIATDFTKVKHTLRDLAVPICTCYIYFLYSFLADCWEALR